LFFSIKIFNEKVISIVVVCVVFIVDCIAVIEFRVDHFSVDVSGDSGVLDVERRRTGKDSDLDGVWRKAGRERLCDAR
jgi:hypothetical protein